MKPVYRSDPRPPREPAGFPEVPPVIASRKLIEAQRKAEVMAEQQRFYAEVIAPRERLHAVLVSVLLLVCVGGAAFLLAFCGAQP